MTLELMYKSAVLVIKYLHLSLLIRHKSPDELMSISTDGAVAAAVVDADAAAVAAAGEVCSCFLRWHLQVALDPLHATGFLLVLPDLPKKRSNWPLKLKTLADGGDDDDAPHVLLAME